MITYELHLFQATSNVYGIASILSWLTNKFKYWKHTYNIHLIPIAFLSLMSKNLFGEKIPSYLPDAIEEQDKRWSTAFRFGWYRVIEWAFERSRPKRMSGLKPFALNQGFKTSNGAAIWVQNDLSQWGDAQRNVHTFWTVNHYIRILLERNAKVK